MAIALSAITISVISLFVAVAHGRTEEKLVAASSWPFLVFRSSENGMITREHTLTMRLQNSGVGPARVHSVKVLFDGRAIRDHADLMAQCCGLKTTDLEEQIKLGLVSQSEVVGVLPAREGVNFLAWRERPGQTLVLKSLNAVLEKLRFEACYCSVLDECWTSDLTPTANPHRVEQCPVDPEAYKG
jgi:hypothetical protein